MHQFLQLNSLGTPGACDDTLFLHLQFEYLLRLELFVHLNFLLHFEVSVRIVLSTLDLLVTIDHTFEQSLLLAYGLHLRELKQLLLLLLMVRLHSLLPDVFLSLALVLVSKVILQLEELTSDFLLAVLRDLLYHAQTSLRLRGFSDLEARCAVAVGRAWHPLIAGSVDGLVIATSVPNAHPRQCICRRHTAVVHGAVRVVHVDIVVVRVFAKLKRSHLRQSLALREERILVKLLLQLQLSQELRPIAAHDEASGVGSLLQLVKSHINVSLS